MWKFLQFSLRYSLTSQLVSRELSNEISSTHQESERVSYQTDISFIKVQRGHRLIKAYVKNPQELRELSKLFVSVGSRALS